MYEMLIGSLEEAFVHLLYGIGVSESLALAGGTVLYGGVLVLPSMVVLVAVGFLLWSATGGAGPETEA